MHLYLDLKKAAGQSSGGTTTKKEEQSVASDGESYVETTSGVSGASAAYDDPDVGKEWQHDEEDSLDNEQEEKRQKRNKKAQKRNLVPTPEEAGTVKKSFDVSALDMVKSLTSTIRRDLSLDKFTPVERDFLKSIKGYTDEELAKGNITIGVRDRQLFSEYLLVQAQNRIDKMYRK